MNNHVNNSIKYLINSNDEFSQILVYDEVEKVIAELMLIK